ncbi:uncharacterized protein LOC134277273 [Saccostrea cucullata]|uniref:uncharacterized protein LOC134277273 n=1 Tax=Saccostrea cuccullata TaxID=36930 RepID=UPI002ED145F7
MAEVKKAFHITPVMRTIRGGYYSMYCIRYAGNGQILASSPVSFDIKIIPVEDRLPTTLSTKSLPIFLTPFEGSILYTDQKCIRKIDGEGDEIFLVLEGDLRGIQYIGPNIIFVCTSSRVEKYTTSGEKLLKIEHDELGNQIYKDPQNISINRNGDICVAEYDETGNNEPLLTVVDQFGKYRFSYPPTPSGSPMDICCDSYCHIIIACRLIHVIDNDGNFLRYLNYDGIQEACSVTIDSEDNLFVSQLNDTCIRIMRSMC